MKFVVLIGGLVGLVVTGTASLLAKHAHDRVFFDAAVGCLTGALLLRWFWRVLVKGVAETLTLKNAEAEEKRQAEEKAKKAALEPKKPAPAGKGAPQGTPATK